MRTEGFRCSPGTAMVKWRQNLFNSCYFFHSITFSYYFLFLSWWLSILPNKCLITITCFLRILTNPHRLIPNFSPFNIRSHLSRYYYVTMITFEISFIQLLNRINEHSFESFLYSHLYVVNLRTSCKYIYMPESVG